MKKQMERWVEKKWGKRCKDFDVNCALCQAWRSFDYLFGEGNVDLLKKEEIKKILRV